jgi:hypothetical protein
VHRVRVWSGVERPILSDEQGARNRCRASYEIAGGVVAMRQRLRCTDASFNFNLQSIGVSHLGVGHGHWSETANEIGELASGAP